MTEILIDECYTLVQRDVKYTLIHATKRVTVNTIGRAVAILEQETGMKRVGIFGYSELSSGSGIMEHPGMKLMIEHANQESPLFEYWLEHGDIRSYRRGLLNRFLISDDLHLISRAQLLNYIRDFKQSTDLELSRHEQQHIEDQKELTKKAEKIKELRRLRDDDQREMDEMEQELDVRMDRIKALKTEKKMLRSLFQY